MLVSPSLSLPIQISYCDALDDVITLRSLYVIYLFFSHLIRSRIRYPIYVYSANMLPYRIQT